MEKLKESASYVTGIFTGKELTAEEKLDKFIKNTFTGKELTAKEKIDKLIEYAINNEDNITFHKTFKKKQDIVKNIIIEQLFYDIDQIYLDDAEFNKYKEQLKQANINIYDKLIYIENFIKNQYRIYIDQLYDERADILIFKNIKDIRLEQGTNRKGELVILDWDKYVIKHFNELEQIYKEQVDNNKVYRHLLYYTIKELFKYSNNTEKQFVFGDDFTDQIGKKFKYFIGFYNVKIANFIEYFNIKQVENKFEKHINNRKIFDRHFRRNEVLTLKSVTDNEVIFTINNGNREIKFKKELSDNDYPGNSIYGHLFEKIDDETPQTGSTGGKKSRKQRRRCHRKSRKHRKSRRYRKR